MPALRRVGHRLARPVGDEKTGTPFRVPVGPSSSGLLIFLDRQAGLDPVLFAFFVLGDVGVAHAG